jgi:hypothetical protein
MGLVLAESDQDAPESLLRDKDPARQRLGEALVALNAAVNPFAARIINDAAVREQYRQGIRAAIREIIDDVNAGRISPETGALRAKQIRDVLMELARQRSSDVGRAMAESLKAQAPTFEQLIAYRARQLFSKALQALSSEERTAVMRAIIERAARDRPAVTSALRFLGPAARGVVALSIGLAIYDIYRAPDHGREALHRGALAGAGLDGSLLIGAVGTSLVCEPGAPVCAAVFALVGGVAFTLGANYWWQRLGP